MGSLLEITLYGAKNDDSDQALEAAFAEVERIENFLSPFKPESALSRVNRQAAYGSVKAGPELITLIRQGLALARLTGGALDFTVGSLMRLWGKRGRKALLSPPTAEQIEETLRCVGYQNVIVNMDHCTVRYRRPGIEIEFGALGKGYAIDRAVEVLKKHGVREALVSFGSTTYALGHPPMQKGWRVAIRNPVDAERVMEVVKLRDCALSTSGDYEQAVWLNGRRYGHILDPRTGHPVSGMAAVSVITSTALEADVFSTTSFVLGSDSGLEFLKDEADVEGLMVSERDDGQLLTARTEGWTNFCRPSRPKGLLARRQFLAGFLVAVGCLMIHPSPSHAVVYLTPEEALQNLIPQAEGFKKETLTLTAEQKKRVETLLNKKLRKKTYPFWVGEKSGRPVGYAVQLNVIGKERPITFMVAISPEGKVQGVEILVYRESQGMEIRSKRFRGQFTGKTLEVPLKLGRDIDSISGASLSSRSTVYAVKKALALVEVLYGKEKR